MMIAVIVEVGSALGLSLTLAYFEVSGKRYAFKGEVEEELQPATLESYLAERIEPAQGKFILGGEFYDDFCRWCKNARNTEPFINPTAFGRRVPTFGFEKERKSGFIRYKDIRFVNNATQSQVIR